LQQARMRRRSNMVGRIRRVGNFCHRKAVACMC
jgi:hypothetical protein